MEMDRNEREFQGWCNGEERTICNYVMYPDMARLLLENNRMNRPLRESLVSGLKHKMTTGKWLNNYDAIIISSDGILLDGQHRLAACIAGNIEFVCDIRVMADKSHFPEINTGVSRTPGDTLNIAGYKNYNQLALAATYLFHYKNDSLLYKNKLPREDILKIVKEYPDILDVSLTYAERAYHYTCLSKGVGMFLHYAFSEIDSDMANEFFNKFSTGENMEHGDPELAITRLLLNNKNSNKRYDKITLMAFIIKAWNARRKGKKLSVIRWEQKVEKFPSIL
jgi:hypothetical protein